MVLFPEAIAVYDWIVLEVERNVQNAWFREGRTRVVCFFEPAYGPGGGWESLVGMVRRCGAGMLDVRGTHSQDLE